MLVASAHLLNVLDSAFPCWVGHFVGWLVPGRSGSPWGKGEPLRRAQGLAQSDPPLVLFTLNLSAQFLIRKLVNLYRGKRHHRRPSVPRSIRLSFFYIPLSASC